MASQQVSQQQCNNSSAYSDIIPFTNNHQLNKSPEENDMKALPQSSNLNKSHQYPSKEIRFNKLNMNSSFNMPSPNTATNISLNEQVLHQKKDQDDYFVNDASLQDEDENDPIFKEYTMINNRRNQTIDEIKNINERIKNNKLKIEEIKQNIVDLKEEKKQKQGDIVNLLSNKESIEEIYKNQIYLLINHINGTTINSNNFNDNNTLNNDTNNLINISIKNEMNDNSIINLNSMHNITICDNEISNTDEDNFKISISEIKNSDQKKYVEQVINMFEDIFKKKDDKINSSITSIINNSYELFINNNGTENDNETNSDLVVNNFFGKLSLFISNHSLGKYSEAKINLFLRYLIKINAINVKLTKYIKFVNKKYKEKKKELNDMISFLEKKNINLADKRHRLENNIKEYDERLEFFGKNDVFEIEQNYEGDEILDNNESNEENKNSMSKQKKLRNKNLITHDNIRKEIENLEKLNNEEQLSHDVVIEYEDGIDQNAEINYEGDDLTDEYDYEKENEMIDQGLNPYNKNISIKKKSLVNKQKSKKTDNKQIIVNDNDESDKYLNELLSNDTNSGENKNKLNKRNSKNIIKNIPRNNVSQSPNLKFKTNTSFQMGKKINYSNNYNYYNTSVVTDTKVYPTPQNLNKTGDNELDNKLSSIELEHYNRVQKIMSAGPNISNIFGVNNYNPENNPIANKDMMFSPTRNASNLQNSSNKIDKTIRYGSRKNHNFISIINMTKNAPVKKKNGKDKTKTKEKSKKNKETDNDGTIKVINLEENFLNELSNDNDGMKNETETENKIGNESTSVLTKSNNLETNTNNKSINISHGSRNNDNSKSNNLIINENSENENNNVVPKRANNNNKDNKDSKDNKEVQGYFLKIVNSKQPNKEKKISNQTQEKTESKDIFNNNSNIKTLKITNCREISVNESKTNNRLMIKKNIPKTMVTKKVDPKSKINHIKRETKENLSLNNTELRAKPYTSLNKNNTQTKLVTHHALSANKNINNSYVNVNESATNRAKSIKEYQPEDNNNRTITRSNQYNTTQRINNNNIKSPNNAKRGKYGNIPISKIKLTNNRSYNSSTFESNFKSGLKVENSNIKSTNRK